MRLPASTYRVQVHGAFPLPAAAEVAPYLRALGVGDLYTSPVLRSTEGSTHGYDVLCHDAIDDEAGGRAGLDTLAEALRRNDLGLVLDIVPNHVSVAPPADANAWWWDVLKHGQDSRHARAFDIEWSRHDGKVLLPVLGAPLVDVMAAGEIVRDGEVLRYHEHVWPIAPGSAGPGDDVADLLPRQHYLPEHWRRAAHDLNYRRFFDVTTLAGLRVEEASVFEETHRLVLSLVRSGAVTGLRVDHPDGLADPAVYLSRLAEGSGGAWTVAEKILSRGEWLPPTWQCAGTTGYDALNEVAALFADPGGEDALTRLYADITGEPAYYEAVVEASKRLVLTEILGSEVGWLHRLAPEEPVDAVVELLVAMDVYRTYVTAGTQPSSVDRAVLARASARAAERRPDLAGAIERLAAHVIDGEHPAFATRFQQVSGPVMAKGVEDTAFYRFNRLVSLNEVGGSPGLFGSSVEAFHEACRLRQERTPYGMTTLSTHDTKRGEDVRARVSLLSEVPEEWAAAVRRWTTMNARHTAACGAPDRNLEYLLYQTFIGAYPLPVDRALAYAEKAAREAKQRTSWLDPDEAYEAGVADWVRAVLSDEEFLADLDVFATPLVVHGWVASLAQKLVQLTMPGVPDVYQGSELWDLSLVDPDNRRPVDYALRAALLSFVDSAPVEAVGERAAEGAPKLLVTSRALRLRRSRPSAFAGAYEPLAVAGGWADRVVAFARGAAVVTVVPRLSVHVDDWKDTTVALPGGAWRNVLTGDDVAGGERLAAELWARFPVALLERV
jgi:(1->4)-alpha-D-glucan 1-alpha-D-glucosylmutase